MTSGRWPERIGRLVLDGDLADVCAIYVDSLDDAEYNIGCERGRDGRGWWVRERDESVRADGYRDYTPTSKADAIRKLRRLSSARVGAADHEWTNVDLDADATEQATLADVERTHRLSVA